MEDKDRRKHTTSDEMTAGRDAHKDESEKKKKGTAKIDKLTIEVVKLKERLEEKTREAEENYNRFLRSCADLENFKKRMEKEKTEIVDFANDRLVKELLQVVDNMERALSHIDNKTDIESLKEGVGLTIDQLFSILKKFGLEQISAVGERFNPNIHEAVSHEESNNHEPESVIKEFQKGYMLKGRLLRPAMVAVSRAPERVRQEEKMSAENAETENESESDDNTKEGERL
ncbi:MAG: nucleotide exchange factor GrpE [Thermodesulfobacteriota bacterium]